MLEPKHFDSIHHLLGSVLPSFTISNEFSQCRDVSTAELFLTVEARKSRICLNLQDRISDDDHNSTLFISLNTYADD